MGAIGISRVRIPLGLPVKQKATSVLVALFVPRIFLILTMELSCRTLPLLMNILKTASKKENTLLR